jgi:hypothetical protein
MSDARIQPGLAPDSFGPAPAAGAADAEPVVDRLMRRVQALEEDKRWWRRAALVSFCLFVFALLGGGVVSIGVGAMYWSAISRQNEQLQQMEDMRVREAETQAARARAETDAARAQAEMARQQAERLADELETRRREERAKQ